ncbi:tRNA(Met) cytidine acetyltransferase TmcA domain-containing protein [Marinobacterium aestuariivivens]|uniref:tRNA(Met) cytidine acetyltransferase TmcA domain-containing protein n=1 Tax=Marinobacterium aestuariivivens TaxID=1698799 RepID=A0ABW1ZTR0_9GAMM
MPPDVLQPLIEANARSRRRQLVWLQGDAGWARRQAAQWLAAAGWQRVLWVGTESPEGFEGLDAAQVQRHLGREYEAVVFDAWCGFNPNAFGQSVGTLRGGGLLFLLTPPAEAWYRHDDPEHRSIAVLPYTERDVGHRFLRHLVTQLEADSRVIPVLQHQPFAVPAPLPAVTGQQPVPEPYRTEDQQQAVSAILQALEASVPLVLTADRGRGKSAALGLAAAHWLEQHGGEVLVTAPGQASVTALFERLQARLADAQLHGGELIDSRGRVRYLTPDRLMQGRVTAPCCWSMRPRRSRRRC